MSGLIKPSAVKRPPISSSAKGKSLRKPNAVRQIMEREQRAREQSAAAAAARAASVSAVSGTATVAGGSSRCPNKACPNPNVVEGTCRTCGRVADDSNIVAEVQFGESSSGAAIVQGSYLAADQGGVRISGGPAFRRVAGSSAGEARERSLKEAKVLMQQYAHRLNISPSLAESGFRLYRMAAMNNFVQGRRIPNVVAMCLFAACRKEQIHKVMLIDLADLCKENVFKLGRNYKAFLAKFPDVKDGPVGEWMEDLIYRFVTKLEFYEHSNKIALSAVRIAKRMQADHMTHGRRPAGICGAAVIMAARAHSFRRTVREVVYIAKVTTHTLQQRMDEFANIPSAQMTIEEFHSNKFLDEQHDPPAWYKKSASWKEKHPGRKRKIQEVDGDDAASPSAADQTGENRESIFNPQDAAGPASGNSPTASSYDASTFVPIDPAILTPPSTSPTQTQANSQASPAPNTDKDGFLIPPVPGKAAERVVTGDERAAIVAARGGDGELETLAQEFGDPDAVPQRSTEAAMAAAQGISIPTLTGKKGTKGRKQAEKAKNVAFDEEWLADEAALEEEVETYLHKADLMSMAVEEVRKEGDIQAATLLEEFAKEQRVDGEVVTALQSGHSIQDLSEATSSAVNVNTESAAEHRPAADNRPRSRVKDDSEVTADEFADDPEVQHCLLDPREAAIKAQIWNNENEDWMRQRQAREHKKKLAAKGPPKKTRKRTKLPRIGEGQASPASSAGEAAVAQFKMRSVSKKLDLTKIDKIFEKGNSYHRTHSTYGGSSAASREASVAPSDIASEVDGEINEERAAAALNGAVRGASNAKDKQSRSAEQVSAATSSGDQDMDMVNEGDEDDQDQTGYDDGQGDYPEEIDPFAAANGGYDEDEWE